MEEVVPMDYESEDQGCSGKIFFPALESLWLIEWLPYLKRLNSLVIEFWVIGILE